LFIEGSHTAKNTASGLFVSDEQNVLKDLHQDDGIDDRVIEVGVDLVKNPEHA
jgi:hypothetical protein